MFAMQEVKLNSKTTVTKNRAPLKNYRMSNVPFRVSDHSFKKHLITLNQGRYIPLNVRSSLREKERPSAKMIHTMDVLS
jgi:hypothetical protein